MRSLLRFFGLWPYLKFLRLQYFASPTQQDEKKLKLERIKFYEQFVTPGDLCYDIGANIGNRTEVLLALGARVIAAEPQHECATILRLRFGRRIKVVEKAIGRTNGKAPMFISESSEISSLSKDWIEAVSQSRFQGKEWKVESQVNVTTLDEIIALYGMPSFCKIDVEGFEEDVLAGLSVPIPLISLEYTIPERIENLSACLNKLSLLGNYVCNYTIGEQTFLEQNIWVTPLELMRIIVKLSTRTLFGDIYIRFV